MLSLGGESQANRCWSHSAVTCYSRVLWEPSVIIYKCYWTESIEDMLLREKNNKRMTQNKNYLKRMKVTNSI